MHISHFEHARRKIDSLGLYSKQRTLCPYLPKHFIFFSASCYEHPCTVCFFLFAVHKAGIKHALCTLCHNSCPPARTKTGCCSTTAHHSSRPVHDICRCARFPNFFSPLALCLALNCLVQPLMLLVAGLHQAECFAVCVLCCLMTRHRLPSGMYGAG